MATSRFLQLRYPGGNNSPAADQEEEQDPNGVYIPGRKGRIDGRPRNVLYLPGTGPGTGRTGIRTGFINRDGSTSALSSPGGYRTGPLSETRPSSLPDRNNPGGGAATTRSLTTSAASSRAANAGASEADTEDQADDSNTESANAGRENSGTSNAGGLSVAEPISLDNPSGSFIHPGSNATQPGGLSVANPISLDNPSGSFIHPGSNATQPGGGLSVANPISLDNPSGSFIHPGSNATQPGGGLSVANPISLDNPTGSFIHPGSNATQPGGGLSVAEPISLDNPSGSFIHPGAAQTNPSGSSEPSENNDGGGGEQASSQGEGLYRPYTSGREGRIDARPKNVTYMPGTGPGTGRTAIRTGVINRDGSTSALSPMGYRTGPLSETRPSSLPPRPAAGAATATTPAAPSTAPPSTAATPGMDGTIKASTAQFGSDPAQQKLQAPKPLTAPVIASSVSLPSDSKPKTAPNAVNSGLDGTLKASTQQFGAPPAAPKPAPTPKPPAAPATDTSAAGNTLKTSTPAPALGTTPALDTKAPTLALTPSLGIPANKSSSSGGLDTLGGSSNKPFGDTSMKGPLDLGLSGVKKRAMGGPVRAGQPYLVGEKGPELIIPRHNGTVVPNHVLKAAGPTEGLLLRPRPAPAEYARHHARRDKARGKGKGKAQADGSGQKKAPQHR